MSYSCLAERLGPEEVERQARFLLSIPVFKQVLAVVPQPAVVVNSHRQIVLSNTAFQGLVGAHHGEAILGCRPGEAVDCVHADLTTGGCGTSRACRKCGAFIAMLKGLKGRTVTHDCTLLCHDGRAIEARISVQPVQIGHRRYLMMFFTDQTAERRRRVLERVFYHDILNTLGAMSGLVDLLDQRVSSDAEGRRFLALMRHQTDTAIEDIEAQRELASAESHELQVHPQDFCVHDLIVQVVHQYANHPLARQKQVVLREATDRWMSTDVRLLRRVLGNLVKNALEASRVGQVVTVRAERSDGGIRFEVHNPTAMTEDVQLQVFKRSFSTRGEGRGVGTYSVKLLTETYLKGKVGFSSAPDSGTTFWFWLPGVLP